MSKFSHIIEETAYKPCDKLLSLLSLATSPNNTKHIYTLYLTEPDRTLFGWNENEEIAGCIGIKRLSNGEVVILHLAVLTHFQSRGIGSAMINFIRFLEPGATLTAETDREAVGFYYKNGFTVRSLGEVYPGTERFSCVRFKNKKEI